MKKLLILMLVLGLASAANAVIITFDAPSKPVCTHTYDRDVLASDVVTIEITSDTALTSSYLVSIMESTSTATDGTSPAVGTLNAAFVVNPVTGNLRNMMTDSGGTARYILIDRISGGVNAPTTIAAGQPLYTFAFTVPSGAVFSDTFTITAAVGLPVVTLPPAIPYSHTFDGVLNVPTTALVLHVIPEPMTIMLLGLGGLLLRRRKGKGG